MSHLLDTVASVDTGVSGLNTLVKTGLEVYAGALGVFLHRASTFVLRYAVGYEMQHDWLGWLIGKNEDTPSLTGITEEYMKIKRAISVTATKAQKDKAWLLKGRTRASERKDPWLRIGGMATLCVQISVYLLAAALTGVALYRNGTDIYACLILGMAVSTYCRGLVSMAILSLNTFVGLGVTTCMAIKQGKVVWSAGKRTRCFWGVESDVLKALRTTCSVVKEEKERNRYERSLATTRVLAWR